MRGEDYQELERAEKGSIRKLAIELSSGMVAFMLELVNTGYGFILRNSFLKRVRELMDSFKARLCVDEVMTAGRTTDTFLLSDAMGLRAEYVSLGKFMTQGVVLERLDVNPQDPDKRRISGVSLGTSLSRMETVLREMASFKEGTVDSAKLRMVHHLQNLSRQPGESRLQDLRFWGRGAIIFCNVWCDRNGVVLGRYLPLLGDPPPLVTPSWTPLVPPCGKRGTRRTKKSSRKCLRITTRCYSACGKSALNKVSTAEK